MPWTPDMRGTDTGSAYVNGKTRKTGSGQGEWAGPPPSRGGCRSTVAGSILRGVRLQRFVMKQVFDRRAFVQLATTFGLTLTVPGLAAKSPALATDEWTLIGEVSELIIPTTDTGGALAAGVPDFVKVMLTDWFSDAERDHFMSGLREFSAGALKKHGKKFGELTASQKN